MKTRTINLLRPQLSALKKYEFKTPGFFNNGIGMVVVIDAANAAACAAMLRAAGETVYEIGVIAARGESASVTVV